MAHKPSASDRISQAWPGILLRSVKLALAYERSRAAHPFAALRAFLIGQGASLARIWRLGLQRHVELTQIELACAQAGLGYPRSEGSVAPPWGLPDQFLTLPTTDLPPHPLIDPQWLSELVKELPYAPQGAIIALHELLSSEGLSSRWSNLPRVGYASLPTPGSARVAVCLHLFYPELWPTLRAALEVIPEPWDLYVSVPEFACTRALAKIAEDHPSIIFLPCANRGRDVLPFLRWLELGVFDRYDAVCKLHTKRSPHISDGARWLAQALQSLLEDSRRVAGLLERFRSASEVGLIGPHELRIDANHPAYLGCNQRILEGVAKRAELPKTKLAQPFFAGTMFWFKPAALAGLTQLKFHEDVFPIEMAQKDGTPAHAIERLIWPIVESSGFKVEEI